MLGEHIGEERGQVLVRRVVTTEGAPKVEVSFEAQGEILGLSTTDMGTYVTTVRPDGGLYGEGSGILRSSDGSEIATWTGAGAGHFTEAGGASYRGALYFQSQTPRLSGLNGIAALFEYSVDGSGKTESTLTEWK
jgi:hypothetical protein